MNIPISSHFTMILTWCNYSCSVCPFVSNGIVIKSYHIVETIKIPIGTYTKANSLESQNQGLSCTT